MPSTGPLDAPQVIHQHTHVHHHVHRVNHWHRKPCNFFVDSFDGSIRRGRLGKKLLPKRRRMASQSSVPRTKREKIERFVRKYVWPILAVLCNVAIFIATRVSFGFGFRVGHLPFFGDNRD